MGQQNVQFINCFCTKKPKKKKTITGGKFDEKYLGNVSWMTIMMKTPAIVFVLFTKIIYYPFYPMNSMER